MSENTITSPYKTTTKTIIDENNNNASMVDYLIFGTGAVNNSFFKINYESELLFMGIIFFIFLLITPLACSKALKISLD